MSPARLPVEIAAEVGTIAADVPAGALDAGFKAACERFDRYVGALAGELAAALAIPEREPVTPERLAQERGWHPGGEPALRWLLETLETYGRASRGADGWTVHPGGGSTPAGERRAAAVAACPGAAPAYDLFDLCGRALPEVLAGRASGEATLFSPATLSLWFDYFSNANPHYALNNTLAAAALSRAVPAGAAVLEVGGGGGSAAQAALAALAAAGRPPARYHFTELHPAFLRRGTRAVQAAAPAGCVVTAARYDIDGDPAGQGLEDGGFDAVLAVNTLHLARDIVPALARLRRLLRPGGALVLGELIRPAPDAAVHIELPFCLLEGYRAAPTDRLLRPRPGFMAAAAWELALRRAGFARVALLPAALQRCVALYPGFYCGALTAS